METKQEELKQEQNKMAVVVNKSKVEKQIGKLLLKEVPDKFKEWKLQDLKDNWSLVKIFLIPQLIEAMKQSIEIKEVEDLK